jgi:hypothetical protein
VTNPLNFLLLRRGRVEDEGALCLSKIQANFFSLSELAST